MNLNADFTKRASMHANTTPWAASPMPGVERRMLDRLGDEVARATTIVRYAAGSKFSPHVHTGGEEFLVLEGVFQDEHGDFPQGSYVRNPPQTRHAPASENGCTIFVKLWQFDMADRTAVRIDTNAETYSPDPTRTNVKVLPLFNNQHEIVRLEQWDANSRVDLSAHEGLEILVLEGSFDEDGEAFTHQSWLRLPAQSNSFADVGAHGARVWIKSGHLKDTPKAPTL